MVLQGYSGIRFFRCYLVVACTLLGFVGVFNGIVDPFGLYYWVKVSGLNEKKPEFFNHLRMTKAHAVRFYRPDGVICGTSRAEYGLDPDHPAWKERGCRRVYNLAFSSCRIYELEQYMRHAYSHGPYRVAVLGLDLFMFDDQARCEAGFSTARLSLPEGRLLPTGWVHDLFVSLISYDALKKSIATLSSQDNPLLITYNRKGMRSPLSAQARIVQRGGHREADGMGFEASAAEDQRAAFSFKKSMRYFRDILDFCRSRGVDLRIFISPVHARFLERLRVWGKWETYEQWKRALVRTLAEEAGIAGAPAFPLWDFSGYCDRTGERFPAYGDRTTRMQWFWESSHYKKELGDLVLNKVLGVEKGNADRFGVRLDIQNIEEYLEAVKRDRAAYIASHLDDVKDIWDRQAKHRPLKKKTGMTNGKTRYSKR